MRKKDILELKKRFKKDHCTFTKMCGCYVNGEKHPILKFRETFLNLGEDDYFKYLEIAKKILSGTIGNNILELNFPLNDDLVNERQISLMQLKSSALKADTLLDSFYDSIISNYDYTGNFLILIFHDAYDVITKTKDNLKVDESEEVYEYIMCAICPVSLSAPGLRYFEEENKIGARVRDWVVEAPTNGFVFPAFINRSTDVNSVMYYTKNAKDTHPELMENTLGCPSKQTATLQREAFQLMIKDSMAADEDKAEKLFMDVQENLSVMIEEYNSMYDDTDAEPITLTKKEIQNLLIESGVPEEIAPKIEESYIDCFGDDLPLAETLIDSKVLKVNEQRKKEEHLIKQVEVLQNRLEELKQETATDISTHEAIVSTSENPDLDEILDNNEHSNLEIVADTNVNDIVIDHVTDNNDYDVILKVKPEKIPKIKSQIIDGQKCIIIPIDDNEHTTVNGLDDLL